MDTILSNAVSRHRHVGIARAWGLTLCLFPLAVMSCGAAAQAAAQPTFDLVCGAGGERPIHFRFDLEHKKWCSGTCSSVWSIDSVSDSTIRVVTFSSDHDNDWDMEINRYTSRLAAVHRGYGDTPIDGGACEAQPFSGFPQRKF